METSKKVNNLTPIKYLLPREGQIVAVYQLLKAHDRTLHWLSRVHLLQGGLL